MGSECPPLSQGATEEFNKVEKVEKNTLFALHSIWHTPGKRHTNLENGKGQTSWDQKKASGILMPQVPMVGWVPGAFSHHSYPRGVMEPSRHEINPFYTCWLLCRSSHCQHVRNSHHLGVFQPWQWLRAQKLAYFCKTCITLTVCMSHSRLKSHGFVGEVAHLILAER